MAISSKTCTLLLGASLVDSAQPMDVSDHELEKEAAYLRSKRHRANAIKKVREKRYTRDGIEREQLRQDLIEQKHLNIEKVVAIEYEAWKLRTMGYMVYEIAEQMHTTEAQVRIWLDDAMAHIRGSTKGLIELDKQIELQRTEELVKHHLPLALMNMVKIERIRQGEPMTVDDFELPQQHTWIVIELIKLRCKILGITLSQAEINMMPVTDVFGWLRTQHEFIRSAVKDAPKDVLTLECDEPIDQPQTEDQRSPEELPDAV